jgi:hypothetical protein
MAHTLNALGVVPAAPGHMKILTDGNATRANIMKGLSWLVAKARPKDTLIFHYSGHGSQVADLDHDELDSKDETICPHDFATAGMIKDDDLRKAFSALPADANLDVFLDSCHSGTGTRDRLSVDEAGDAVTIRYVEPPLDVEFFIGSNPHLPTRRLLRGRSEERQVEIVSGLNHALWAGCRDNQTSAEAQVDGVFRGIFTFCYCKALRRAGLGITRRRLDALVSSDVKALGYGQVPQLEGTSKTILEPVFT